VLHVFACKLAHLLFLLFSRVLEAFAVSVLFDNFEAILCKVEAWSEEL